MRIFISKQEVWHLMSTKFNRSVATRQSLEFFRPYYIRKCEFHAVAPICKSRYPAFRRTLQGQGFRKRNETTAGFSCK